MATETQVIEAVVEATEEQVTITGEDFHAWYLESAEYEYKVVQENNHLEYRTKGREDWNYLTHLEQLDEEEED